jgi:hypothetical protein
MSNRVGAAEQQLRERTGRVSDRFTKEGAPPVRRPADTNVREMPEPPRKLWRVVGPGIVGAGVGLASGEFLVSPITGEEEAAGGGRYSFEPDERNLASWRRWWRFANVEQAMTFVAITILTIAFMSMLSYSTVFGQPDLPDDIGFLEVEGQRLNDLVGSWMGPLFWSIGAFSLFAASMGIVDYTSRLAADVLKTTYRPRSSESRLYFGVVWGLVAIGVLILVAGLDQPLVLLVISACVAAVTMFVYSILLLITNRRYLPEAIQIRSYRVGALVFAAAFFGVLSAITIVDQVGDLV